MNNSIRYIIATTLIGALACTVDAFASSEARTQLAATNSDPATAIIVPSVSPTTDYNGGLLSQPMNNARPAAELIKSAREFGYSLKIDARDGKYVFCKSESHIGTRLETESCLDGEQFAMIRGQRERNRIYLRTVLGI